MRAVPTLFIAVLAAACLESSVNDPPTVVSIELTAAQAAAVNGAIRTVALTTPDIAGLVDSTNLVLKAGVLVDSAAIDVTFGGGPYYAVSLQRTVTQPTTAFANFYAIYFDNPSNPTRLVIVSAFARGNVGPPDGVLANLAAPTAVLIPNVHFYAIDGQAVTHWKATAGSLVLGNGLQGGACPGFTAEGPVICETADLLIGASVAASVRESGTAAGTPTLSIVDGLVRGIKLKFTLF